MCGRVCVCVRVCVSVCVCVCEWEERGAATRNAQCEQPRLALFRPLAEVCAAALLEPVLIPLK